jgi:Flp pilus assembly protein TadB
MVRAMQSIARGCVTSATLRNSMPSGDQTSASPQTLIRLMYVSALVTVLVAIILGALVSPFLFAIALLAIVDLWLARAYATGRLRMASDPRLARPEEGGVVEGDAATADPSYNPYARED